MIQALSEGSSTSFTVLKMRTNVLPRLANTFTGLPSDAMDLFSSYAYYGQNVVSFIEGTFKFGNAGLKSPRGRSKDTKVLLDE